MKIKKNIPLKNLSTFKIGGKGLYLVEVEKKEEIKKAILFPQKKKLSFFILGNGSKILFPDGTLNKVLIKIKIKTKLTNPLSLRNIPPLHPCKSL